MESQDIEIKALQHIRATVNNILTVLDNAIAEYQIDKILRALDDPKVEKVKLKVIVTAGRV